MTKVKMCGLRRTEDIMFANSVLPDFVGYVFAPKSKRFITPDQTVGFTELLDDRIIPVGVFVNEPVENVIKIFNSGAIKIAQLHGNENEDFIAKLQSEKIPVIKAFIVKTKADIEAAEVSPADHILLDAGMGDGRQFSYDLLNDIRRPYFLAGGLDTQNVSDAVSLLKPYAVDVSSGIETDGFKDCEKMKKFMEIIKQTCS